MDDVRQCNPEPDFRQQNLKYIKSDSRRRFLPNKFNHEIRKSDRITYIEYWLRGS
jgi:hypothetical protein